MILVIIIGLFVNITCIVPVLHFLCPCIFVAMYRPVRMTQKGGIKGECFFLPPE